MCARWVQGEGEGEGEDGIRTDREFLNSEGTMIFRSRTAEWDYVEYMAPHSTR